MTPLVRLLAIASLVAAGLVLPGAAPSAAQAAPSRPAPSPPTAGQSTYVPRTPVRLLDTRETRTPLGPGETRSLRVAGVQGVPADATAVVLSVTAIGPTEATQVEVTPTSASAGTTSLVVRARSSASNLVTVAVGPDGAVVLRNARGSVGLIVDLSGHYARGAGSTFVPVTPSRLLDTRETRTPLRDAEVRTLRVVGSGTRVPAEATAVALNLTAVGATRSTDVRAYPAGPVPYASNSNPGPGRPTSVLAVVQVGQGGAVSVRNAAGTVHLVVDLQGWFVPSASDPRGSVFHPVAPRRVLDAAATREGSPRDVVVAGVGSIPAQATGVALAVTATGSDASTDVRVYPVPADGRSVPPSSNINPGVGVDVTGGVLTAVGRDGAVRLRTNSGSVRLTVDLLGWYGPPGRGWDVSWPQCTTRGATTSRLPSGGAFAVVGLTRGAPFGNEELPYNECFDAQWRWASSLPGEPAVYLNVDAPGPRATNSGRVWAQVCGSGRPTSACALRYGERIAAHALARMPRTPDGGRPMVWMDIEGPYANGPYWQTGYAGAVAVNRAVLQGVVDGLRRGGHRVGTYTDRGSVPDPNNDWRAIMGQWRLLQMQNWVFRSPDADPRTVCGPEHSATGGPVVMAQVQPPTNPGVPYDVNELC